MKRSYFGTDGVRGPYGGPVVNEAFAARLGEAAGLWVGGKGRVFIGRDTRASGESLARALAAGLAIGTSNSSTPDSSANPYATWVDLQ